MLVKITEQSSGTFLVEGRRGKLGTFENTTRTQIVNLLREKANEIGETLRVVDEFEERPENIDWSKVMKPRW